MVALLPAVCTDLVLGAALVVSVTCTEVPSFPSACAQQLTMRPDVVVSLMARLCFEVTPITPTGNHLPFLLVLHVIMLVRNAAHLHTDEETAALSSYLAQKAASFKTVHDAAKWFAGCLGVTEETLDVRERITVCSCSRRGIALREGHDGVFLGVSGRACLDSVHVHRCSGS